jgi:hypothetical protein
MEKAMILAELKALKEAGVEVGSYMDVGASGDPEHSQSETG